MGYLNKTCSAGSATSDVDRTSAGPLLRAASDVSSWKMFTLKKAGSGSQQGEEELVEIETYYPSAGKKPL
jgi:hypothetical protein